MFEQMWLYDTLFSSFAIAIILMFNFSAIACIVCYYWNWLSCSNLSAKDITLVAKWLDMMNEWQN